jgi:hypothetical protein
MNRVHKASESVSLSVFKCGAADTYTDGFLTKNQPQSLDKVQKHSDSECTHNHQNLLDSKSARN